MTCSFARPVLLTLLTAGVLPAAAQSPATYPRSEVRYYDAGGSQLTGEQGADHRAEVLYLDSVQTQERLYYPSGKLREFGRYLAVRHEGQLRRVAFGRHLEYYEGGQLHVQTDFAGRQQPGERLVYYPDGKLRRRDKLPAEGEVTGECFSPDGQPVAYFPYETMPVYLPGNGGQDAVIRAIQQRVRYPVEALRNQVEGRVFVEFQVDKTGHVQQPRIVGWLNESRGGGGAPGAVRQIGATVLEAVNALGAFQPGQRDGEAVATTFTLPITFKIQ